MEIILRIYNPFPSGIKGNKIVLRVNTVQEYENDQIPVIDRNIFVSRNGLGFRGPDTPSDWNSRFRIFTVGGSTTECTYLSDGKTWTDKLYQRLSKRCPSVWMNNAGIADHSTFGHKILLEDYLIKLHPDMLLFLTGCNDIGRDDLIEKAVMKDSYGSVWSFFTKNSELINVLSTYLFTKRPKSKNFTDKYIDLSKNQDDTISFSGTEILNEVKKHQQLYLPAYEKRTEELIRICADNKIDPVFITQPTLFGSGVDPVTGANLENRKIGLQYYNGKLWSVVLDLYNDVTRKLCVKHNLLLVDLARKMPRSSLYFYDMVHFTDQGTDAVSSIISLELNRYLTDKMK